MQAKNSILRAASRLIIWLLLITSCQVSAPLLQLEKEDLPVLMKILPSGQQLQVSPLVEGAMNLYFRMIPISEANLYNPYFPYNEPAEVPQFFIGKKDLMRIDEWNYESVLEQVMSDKQTLIKSLGKQGFRFENLQQMVVFYNQQSEMGVVRR